jgi:hypothetical protein
MIYVIVQMTRQCGRNSKNSQLVMFLSLSQVYNIHGSVYMRNSYFYGNRSNIIDMSNNIVGIDD